MGYSNNINQLINNVTKNTEKVFNNIQVISDKLDAQVQTIKYTVKSYDNIRAEADNVITQIESVNKSVNSLSQEKNTIIEKDWKHFRYIQPGCGFSRRDNCIRSNGGRKCAAAFP